MKAAPKVISLFSGAMGLDIGLERAGLHTSVCVEMDKLCCDTMRFNRPELPVIQGDVTSVSTEAILQAAGLRSGDAFAVVGGPPCQPFSTGGLRQTIRDKRGSLFADFVRIVEEAQPLYFVFENVAQLITAAVKHRPIAERPGQRWHLSSYKETNTDSQIDGIDNVSALADDEQAGSALDAMLEAFDALGYSLSFGILNSANYGAPQVRLRFVAIGSRVDARVALPAPTHSADGTNGLPLWRNLRDAIGDLQEDAPMHSRYGERFESYFKLIPPGGSWRSLPPHLQREALGEKSFVAGGGKTGFFRRLSWDAPAPTLVGKANRKSSAICHPSEVRPLSVRESARVQGFPDDWTFCGNMHSNYLQIGNAVPVPLGEAIGRALILSYTQSVAAGRPTPTDEELRSWKSRKNEMLDDAHRVLRSAARNKRSRKVSDSEQQQGEELLLSL